MSHKRLNDFVSGGNSTEALIMTCALTTALGFDRARGVMQNVLGVVDGSHAVPIALGSFIGDFPQFMAQGGGNGFSRPPPPQPQLRLLGNGRSNSDPKDCSICLGKITPGAEDWLPHYNTPCNHAYHTACLERWLRTGASNCPICRFGLNLSR